MGITAAAAIVLFISISVFTNYSLWPSAADDGAGTKASKEAINTDASSSRPAAVTESRSAASTDPATSAPDVIQVLLFNGEPAAGSDVFYINEDEIYQTRPARHADPPALFVKNANCDERGRLRIAADKSKHAILLHAGDGAWKYISARDRRQIIQLPKAAVSIIRVVDTKNAPVPNIKIAARRIPYKFLNGLLYQLYDSSPECLARSQCEYYESTTDADGDARFTGPIGGAFHFKCIIPDLGTIIYTGGFIFGERAILTIPPRCAVEGTVYGEGGAAVANAAIKIVDKFSLTPLCAAAPSDESGHFRLEGMIDTNRATSLMADAPGYAAEAVPVSLASDGNIIVQNIYLKKPLAIGGRVVSTNGEPVVGATVVLYAQKRAAALASCESAAGGEFHFTNAAAPTSGEIGVVASGFAPAFVLFNAETPIQNPIVITPGGKLIINLEGGDYHLGEGEVVEAALRPDANVPWPASDSKIIAFRETPKVIEIPVDAPGIYTFSLDTPRRMLIIQKNIEIKSGETKSMDVKLEDGATIRGRVIHGTTKEGIGGVAVYLLQPVNARNQYGQICSHTTKTGSDGTFTMTGVPPGMQQFATDSKEWQGRFFEVNIANTASSEIAPFDLYKTAYLRGKITFLGARPSDLEVCLRGPLGAASTAPISNDGQFFWINLTPDTYKLFLRLKSDPYSEFAQTKIKMAPETDYDIELTLGACSIRGSITNPPSDMRRIFLQILNLQSGERIADCTIRSDATFSIPSLPSGDFQCILFSENQQRILHSARTIQLKPGVNELQITLSGSTFELAVADLAGHPVGGAALMLGPVNSKFRKSQYVGTTDAAGKIICYDIEPGKQRVGLYKIGFDYDTRWYVDIKENTATTLEAKCARESPLTIRVTDAANATIPSARAAVVRVEVPDDPEYYESSGDDGVIRSKNRGAGEKLVTARGAGYFPNRKNIQLSVEAAAELNIQLLPSASLVITVNNSSGSPVAGVPVVITAPGVDGTSADWIARGWTSATPANATTGADGKLTIQSVPAGALSISAGGASAIVNTKKGEEAAVTVQIP